jgi:hypothetical protein
MYTCTACVKGNVVGVGRVRAQRSLLQRRYKEEGHHHTPLLPSDYSFIFHAIHSRTATESD